MTNESELHTSGDIDPALLARVRALLAKAEATSFEHEAATFTAKAYELIAKYAIDEALLADPTDEPTTRTILIDAPYASAKFVLLSAVSSAARGRAVWASHTSTATVVGFPRDLAAIEVLFTSLLLQASTAMIAAGPQRDRSGKVRTKSFRQSFLLGFAGRVAERLSEAEDRSTAAATLEHGDQVLPVLASIDAAVEAKLHDEFPRLGTMTSSLSSGAGLRAGRSAGDQARLGTTDLSARRRAIEPTSG